MRGNRGNLPKTGPCGRIGGALGRRGNKEKMAENREEFSFGGNGPFAEGVTVYTDGGCLGNPGPGGWGCVVIVGDEITELSGGESLTTNNRMELTAAISALRAVSKSERLRGLPVRMNIDSQYVRNGITLWIRGWKKNGWRTSSKKPVLNQDLWRELDSLNSSLDVEWNWVKGHSGVEHNERCDRLCRMEMSKLR